MRFSLTRLSDILLSTALRHAVAILFKPFSYKEMANKIIQIINDPIRMQNMMENAIAKVNVFSVKNVADEWEKQIIK